MDGMSCGWMGFYIVEGGLESWRGPFFQGKGRKKTQEDGMNEDETKHIWIRGANRMERRTCVVSHVSAISSSGKCLLRSLLLSHICLDVDANLHLFRSLLIVDFELVGCVSSDGHCSAASKPLLHLEMQLCILNFPNPNP